MDVKPIRLNFEATEGEHKNPCISLETVSALTPDQAAVLKIGGVFELALTEEQAEAIRLELEKAHEGEREIEKKGVVLRIDPIFDLDSFPKDLVFQNYIYDTEETEIRVREIQGQKGIKRKMTIKQGHGLSRIEIEFDISEDQYKNLLPFTLPDHEQIIKWRFKIPKGEIGSKKETVDVFIAPLSASGRMLKEVEFGSDDEANAYVDAFPGDVIDVTGQEEYGNLAISEDGWPQSQL